MHKACVNKVLPFSLVDGPGCRCAVFLQGCNISCAYCHNPETQRQCTHCGLCVDSCPTGALSLENGRVLWRREACRACDRCIAVCPSRSSPKVRLMDAGQVHGLIRESLPFIRGVTVSGGECMLYPEFLKELFALCRADHLTCLIDSNGTIAFDRELLELCDGVMLDVKAWDSGRSRALTGSGNAQVLKNLQILSNAGKLEEIRIVCLPGYVDAEEAIRGISRLLGPQISGSVRLKLIRFRPNGVKGELASHPATELSWMEGLQIQGKLAGFGNIMIM